MLLMLTVVNAHQASNNNVMVTANCADTGSNTRVRCKINGSEYWLQPLIRITVQS